ncbi:MAG: TraB/GumN family protein, partial [Kiloniellales bacterium]|nr:TraB/GumN family protein [Kiloniellales bacterium]
QQKVLREGKEVVGLETLGEQLALFEGASEEDQTIMLRAVVEDRQAVRRQFDGMLSGYLNRDLSALYAEMRRQTENELKEVEDFEENFVVSRNHRMAERLKPHLAAAPTFVAVGALHLPGEEGLISLLHQQGYKVTRLY